MILLIFTLAAAAVILFNGLIVVLNQMSRHTAHGIRIAWILMTTGALGALLSSAFEKWQPSLWEMALLVGLALYMIFERRRPVGCGGAQ